jgi:hypothetical protein
MLRKHEVIFYISTVSVFLLMLQWLFFTLVSEFENKALGSTFVGIIENREIN